MIGVVWMGHRREERWLLDRYHLASLYLYRNLSLNHEMSDLSFKEGQFREMPSAGWHRRIRMNYLPLSSRVQFRRGLGMEAGYALHEPVLLVMLRSTHPHNFLLLLGLWNKHAQDLKGFLHKGLFLTQITFRLWVSCSSPSLCGLGSDVLHTSSFFWSVGWRHSPV